MTFRDADALARSYIEGQGLGELFGHGLGHGIGLEVHEAPRLSKIADGALQEGTVVTIEPGIYRAGWGGVRVEDDVVIEGARSRILTEFPRTLMELS
jgi:Xaa-Pro aminopeptidase